MNNSPSAVIRRRMEVDWSCPTPPVFHFSLQLLPSVLFSCWSDVADSESESLGSGSSCFIWNVDIELRLLAV